MSNLLGLDQEKPEGVMAVDAGLAPDPEWALKVKGGANWFYWIAALSLINSGAFVMGANFQFLAGLGLTAVSDAVIQASIDQGASPGLKVVAVVFDLVVVIGFALAGYFANKFFTTAFFVGIVVYVCDTLIVLLLGEYLMAGFHVFALFFITRGFLACRELKKFEASQPNTQPLPPPPPANY